MAYQGQDATLDASTYQAADALWWQIQQDMDHEDWVSYYPTLTNGQVYTLSVDLAGSAQAFLDVWDGQSDHQSDPINLNEQLQTLTLTAQIPANAPTGSSQQAPQLQVRVPGDAQTNVLIKNASVRLATANSGS